MENEMERQGLVSGAAGVLLPVLRRGREGGE